MDRSYNQAQTLALTHTKLVYCCFYLLLSMCLAWWTRWSSPHLWSQYVSIPLEVSDSSFGDQRLKGRVEVKKNVQHIGEFAKLMIDSRCSNECWKLAKRNAWDWSTHYKMELSNPWGYPQILLLFQDHDLDLETHGDLGIRRTTWEPCPRRELLRRCGMGLWCWKRAIIWGIVELRRTHRPIAWSHPNLSYRICCSDQT